MANGSWNGSVSDSISKLAIGNARITVTDPATGDLVGLYEDREGLQPKGNPFLTPPDGKIQFFARAGRVDITGRYQGKTFTFENEIILDDWGAVCVCGEGVPEVMDMVSLDTTATITPTIGENETFVFFGITFGELPEALNLRMAFADSTVPVFEQVYMPFNEFEGDSTGRYFFVGALPFGYAGYDGASELTLETDGFGYETLNMNNITGFIVQGLREASDIACMIDNVFTHAEGGFFDTGVMDAACPGSFIAYQIMSPAGMAGPTNNTGFTHEETGSAGGLNRYFGYGYAAGDTSKQVTVSVGSGPIYGAMIILRASLEAVGPSLQLRFDDRDLTAASWTVSSHTYHGARTTVNGVWIPDAYLFQGSDDAFELNVQEVSTRADSETFNVILRTGAFNSLGAQIAQEDLVEFDLDDEVFAGADAVIFANDNISATWTWSFSPAMDLTVGDDHYFAVNLWC